ncbi:hypothetical protein M3Y99_00680000 [Aphelenchoides fujianensis]|nr:hypothetical protein M3Y99_00680000 [Aphelenchoides fujianensis]
MWFLFVALVFSVQLVDVEALGFTQSVAVSGRLFCNNRPASNIRLKLYEDDGWFEMDDLMAEGRTDAQGNFFLSGQEREFTKIEPVLNIYFNCNDGLMPCDRKLKIFIPKSYVSDGAIPYEVYKVGVLNLDGKFAGETRDCLNR